MTKRIAVATDFSPESEIALREALAMARTVGAEINLLHVTDRFTTDNDDDDVKELQNRLREDTREKLSELHDKFDGQGVQISQSLLDGPIAATLCAAADELGCQTIALGTHGRTGVKRFFLGSVAEKVARCSKSDVLIARGSRTPRGYRRIMVPTDFSPPAARALQRAVELAAPGAEIDLVHIWQLPAPITVHYAPVGPRTQALRNIAAQMQADAEKQAAPLLERFRDADVAIEFTAMNGSPGPGIIDRAPGCDLIAVGTHGRTGFTRFALGSVAERTIRHAPCSVLATHQDDKE